MSSGLRLNIGCGANIFPLPWVNVDLTDLEKEYFAHLRPLAVEQVESWPKEQRQHVDWLQGGRMKFFRHDLRHGFGMFDDGTIDAAYLGQCVEHLNPRSELPALLKECRRLLKPGGRVRITTPDLTKLLAAYAEHRMSDFESEQPEFYRELSPAGKLSAIMFGAAGAGCTRENYEGHFACWTTEDLIAELGAAGLSAHVAVEPSEMFRDCRDYGLSHSMALEAVKP